MDRKIRISEMMKAQLAVDFNCDPADFDREETVLTLPAANPGRRIYTEKPAFLSMATFGKNTVIMADEAMHPWLREWSRGKQGIWLFEHDHLTELEHELSKYGHHLWQTHHMYLPDPEKTVYTEAETALGDGLTLRWFEQADIAGLYGCEAYGNALCDHFCPERPDMLAAAALEGEKIVGIAGCSADTPLFWQVGIDVLPEARQRGLGTKLVKLLSAEILKRSAIPFYGTSLSNIASQNIALKAGYYPAWVETETKQ